MRIGYLDCFSGISGDMVLGAIVGAGVPLPTITSALDALNVEGYRLSEEQVTRCGVGATRVKVELDSDLEHPHRNLKDVLQILDTSGLPAGTRDSCARVFRTLAEAEALVHHTSVDNVLFHEVGAVDSICDIVGAVVGFEALALDSLLFSTVSLGGGTVKVAHGTLPVPAPATAELLRGLPTRGGPVEMELATPTGAALLKTFGQPRAYWPQMRIETISYGAGARDLEELPNVLRFAVGRTESEHATESDCVWVVEANIDDMTGEEIGFCVTKLQEAGALEVFTTPVQMKKSRPGIQLTTLCAPEHLRRIEEVLWRHSSTLGLRRNLWQRSTLRRETHTVHTPWGPVRVKVAFLGDERIRCKPEYEDCRRIAEANNVPLAEVYETARHAEGG